MATALPTRIIFSTAVNELDSWSFTGTLTKDDGTALGPTALDTLRLWLYDVASNSTLNSVSDVDILNTGRGTLDSAGHLVVSLGSADNPIVDDTQTSETHRALLVATWNSGTGRASQEVDWPVTNLIRVPA